MCTGRKKVKVKEIGKEMYLQTELWVYIDTAMESIENGDKNEYYVKHKRHLETGTYKLLP